MRNTDEIRRLLNGPRPGEAPGGPLLRFHAECDVEAAGVLQSVREVWATALWQADPGRLSTDEWKMILPRWFVGKFASELKVDDPLLRRAFQLQDRMRPAEAWTLSEWVRSLEPATRHWSWWSAQIPAPCVLDVTVAINGDGAGADSLQWVLRCAGAQTVELLR